MFYPCTKYRPRVQCASGVWLSIERSMAPQRDIGTCQRCNRLLIDIVSAVTLLNSDFRNIGETLRVEGLLCAAESQETAAQSPHLLWVSVELQPGKTIDWTSRPCPTATAAMRAAQARLAAAADLRSKDTRARYFKHNLSRLLI